MSPSAPSGRGFANLSAERRREIASLGGQAAHKRGTAHQFTSDEGRDAGRKGGIAISTDRDHMPRIGRAGSHKRWQRESPGDDKTAG